MKKKYIVLIIATIIVLAFLFMTNIINPVDKSCSSGSDCILAYTGLEPCAPCDQADNEMQCVSLKEADELQNRRKSLGMGGFLCATCLTPKILYRCICGQTGCEKTTSCSIDSECKTKSYPQGYACINNECKYFNMPSP